MNENGLEKTLNILKQSISHNLIPVTDVILNVLAEKNQLTPGFLEECLIEHCKSDHPEIVENLISRYHVDVEKCAQNPIIIAAKCGQEKIIPIFIKSNLEATLNTLRQAIRGNLTSIASNIIISLHKNQTILPPNFLQQYQDLLHTHLLNQCRFGNYRVITKLVEECGQNIVKCDRNSEKRSYNFIRVAAMYGHENLVTFFKKINGSMEISIVLEEALKNKRLTDAAILLESLETKELADLIANNEKVLMVIEESMVYRNELKKCYIAHIKKKADATDRYRTTKNGENALGIVLQKPNFLNFISNVMETIKSFISKKVSAFSSRKESPVINHTIARINSQLKKLPPKNPTSLVQVTSNNLPVTPYMWSFTEKRIVEAPHQSPEHQPGSAGVVNEELPYHKPTP